MSVYLLNGPSSSGKSSISEALKELTDTETTSVIVSIDNYLKPNKNEPIWEDDVFELMPQMCAEISAAVAEGKNVIIDHVITSERIYNAICKAVGSASLFKVLVHCDLSVLEEREALRGNRHPGTAKASLEYLYPKQGYDIRINTVTFSAQEAAKTIFTAQKL